MKNQIVHIVNLNKKEKKKKNKIVNKKEFEKKNLNLSITKWMFCFVFSTFFFVSVLPLY